MKVSYFPGCTLRTTAKQLDVYARRSARALGIELCELENWQCCGGVFVSAKDEIASKLPAVRALAAAHREDRVLVSVCSACHNVLKQTNDAMLHDGDFADHVNRYLSQDADFSGEYHGETRVMHYLEMLRDLVGFDTIRQAVKNPLTGRKIGAYYGCLLLRPGKVLQFDDPENPKIMEDFLRALGAEPVLYSMRNECCGGYTVLENGELCRQKSEAIGENAADRGAEMLVTACPLCKYNLDRNQDYLPVVYFTELLAEALGIKEDCCGE